MKANLAPLGLLAGSLIVALLLAEMTLRLLGVTCPSVFMHDLDHGGQLRPGAVGWRLNVNERHIRSTAVTCVTGHQPHHISWNPVTQV